MKKASVVDTLATIKKGDLLYSKICIWEVTQVCGGNVIAKLLWKTPEHDAKSPNVMSKSLLKHFIVAGTYTVIPKANKSTIQVLFT